MRLYTINQAKDQSCLVTVSPVLEEFHIIPPEGAKVPDLHHALNLCIRDQIHDIEMYEVDTAAYLPLFGAYSVESDENLTVEDGVTIYSITGEELVNKMGDAIDNAINQSRAELRQAIREKLQELLKEKGRTEIPKE